MQSALRKSIGIKGFEARSAAFHGYIIANTSKQPMHRKREQKGGGAVIIYTPVPWFYTSA